MSSPETSYKEELPSEDSIEAILNELQSDIDILNQEIKTLEDKIKQNEEINLHSPLHNIRTTLSRNEYLKKDNLQSLTTAMVYRLGNIAGQTIELNELRKKGENTLGNNIKKIKEEYQIFLEKFEEVEEELEILKISSTQ